MICKNDKSVEIQLYATKKISFTTIRISKGYVSYKIYKRRDFMKKIEILIVCVVLIVAITASTFIHEIILANMKLKLCQYCRPRKCAFYATG